MDRASLSLAVVPAKGPADKLSFLASWLREAEGTGLLYCATRDQTALVADYLSARGLDVVAYHAGLPPEEKRRLQEAFTRGAHQAIAATNALGMGIDKADLRFVVHVDVPGSITAYYQEVGRAGRDGLPARGILLFDPDDRRIQSHFIQSAQPTPEDFSKILSVLEPGPEGFPNLSRVKSLSGLHPTRVTVVLAELREQGFVEKVLDGRRQVYRRVPGVEGAPDLSRYARQNEVRARELETMLGYGAGEVACRMQALRVALGDAQAGPCGRCDLCAPGAWALPDVDEERAAAEAWLADRVLPLPAKATHRVDPGVTLLASEDRSPLFLRFMRAREATELEPELAERLARAAAALPGPFSAVVPIPSRTWGGRGAAAAAAGAAVGAPVLEALAWRRVPERRQGELLNNDQRKENVKGALTARRPPGDGAILLLDDYTGSGATLAEAARALRKEACVSGRIVPFTLARVKWRLGARGIV
jgi:ATP-dependent DNA helicase RecQ